MREGTLIMKMINLVANLVVNVVVVNDAGHLWLGPLNKSNIDNFHSQSNTSEVMFSYKFLFFLLYWVVFLGIIMWGLYIFVSKNNNNILFCFNKFKTE